MTTSVFVSSTFIDLTGHRQLVFEAVSALALNSHAMEFFGAMPDTPKEECLRLVRSATAYVGVFAMRYGKVDEQTGKSLTHLEYEEAQSVGLPSLVYLMDEDAHPVLPKHVETGESAQKLRSLKELLKQRHVVSFFSSPEDLAARVASDLSRLVGTLSTRPTAQVLSQLAANRVTRHPLTPPRFEFIRSKITKAFKRAVPDAVLREALELLIAGDNMAAAFVLSRGAPMSLDDAVDGMMEVDRTLRALMEQHAPPSQDA
jgi:hypothetical protein